MNLLRDTATVGGMTMVSRVLGFARDALMASILGTGPVADAFVAGLKWAFLVMGGLLVLGVGITIARGEHPKQGLLERQEPTGAEATGI